MLKRFMFFISIPGTTRLLPGIRPPHASMAPIACIGADTPPVGPTAAAAADDGGENDAAGALAISEEELLGIALHFIPRDDESNAVYEEELEFWLVELCLGEIADLGVGWYERGP
jgi:hypothetical protein